MFDALNHCATATYVTYGISGASGRHCCLWCQISSDCMQIPLLTRQRSECRTLNSLKLNFANFVEVYQKNIKKAMFVFNVIDNVFFFYIPINDICIPGLHITLGVYLKLFRMFEYAVKQIDL